MRAMADTPLDRVAERQRAVALARHYREAEGLSIAQIAERLGRAPTTVRGYFYDPSDANKGPSWEREAEPGGRELRSHAPAAPSRGDVLPRRTFFCARLASALRRCAVLLRLVAHARTPARRRGAHTTTCRRMARAIHCHRSVRELGGGRRGRLRRRLNARASMPLTYERGLALDRL